jgi:hypothetical protein
VQVQNSLVRKILVVATALAGGTFLFGVTGSAWADDYGTCPTAYSSTHAWTGGTWNPSGSNVVYGVEAPIEYRNGASICQQTHSPGEGDESSVWIAVETATHIVQIGFVQVVYDSAGDTHQCSFWAHGTGTVHPYDCGLTSATTKYFRIEEDSQFADYNIEDCGTGPGYGSCVSKNATQSQFTATDKGAAVSEVSFPCRSQMMGGLSSKVDYGSSSYYLKGQNSIGGSWAVHDFGTPVNSEGCSQYLNDRYIDSDGTDTDIMQTWDTRN